MGHCKTADKTEIPQRAAWNLRSHLTFLMQKQKGNTTAQPGKWVYQVYWGDWLHERQRTQSKRQCLEASTRTSILRVRSQNRQMRRWRRKGAAEGFNDECDLKFRDVGSIDRWCLRAARNADIVIHAQEIRKRLNQQPIMRAYCLEFSRASTRIVSFPVQVA